MLPAGGISLLAPPTDILLFLSSESVQTSALCSFPNPPPKPDKTKSTATKPAVNKQSPQTLARTNPAVSTELPPPRNPVGQRRAEGGYPPAAAPRPSRTCAAAGGAGTGRGGGPAEPP